MGRIKTTSVPRRDICAELDALISRAGLRVTFDSRRYARAARDWPDFLPPMFAEAEIAVERWGMNGRWSLWEPRPPAAWPAPTVVVGELWEQKSALMPTWADAATAPFPYTNTRHEIRRIDGEQFLNERGFHYPWAPIPGPHWRRLAPPPVPIVREVTPPSLGLGWTPSPADLDVDDLAPMFAAPQ